MEEEIAQLKLLIEDLEKMLAIAKGRLKALVNPPSKLLLPELALIKLSELGLSNRVLNSFLRCTISTGEQDEYGHYIHVAYPINTVGELVEAAVSKITYPEFFGPKGQKELYEALKKLGISKKDYNLEWYLQEVD